MKLLCCLFIFCVIISFSGSDNVIRTSTESLVVDIPPIEAAYSKKSNSSVSVVSHIKPRKEADPKLLLKKEEGSEKTNTSESGNRGVNLPNKNSSDSLDHASEKHLGREGVNESSNNATKPRNSSTKLENSTLSTNKNMSSIIPPAILASNITKNVSIPITTPANITHDTNVTTSKNMTTKASNILTSSTTTTTASTTTTTTTPKPKKPQITYSVEDMPSIAKVAPESKKVSTGNLNVEEPEQPIVQPSREQEPHPTYHDHRDYIIPIVALIFAVPILMGAIIVSYRRIKDYWSTRHYRRMDFLVDGMYND